MSLACRISTSASLVAILGATIANPVFATEEESGCTAVGEYSICSWQQECTPASAHTACQNWATLFGWDLDGYACIAGAIIQCTFRPN